MRTTMLAALCVIAGGCAEAVIEGGTDGAIDGAIADGAIDGGGDREDGSRESPRDAAGPPACVAPASPTPDWFVAPSGTAGGAGTAGDPLDLATAVSSSGPVRPGDRVQLAGGVYAGAFRVTVSGAAGAPIVFAAAPGARVTLDSAAAAGIDDGVRIDGAWVELHGLEITNGGTDRSTYPGGVAIFGAHTRLVNCVVHDTAQGVSFWSSAIDSELYGNILYHNGWEGPDRGHGHAVYTQNDTGTKRIASNIVFFGYAFGIHAYTEGGSIRGFDIVDNVWFRTGASRPGSSSGGTSDGCLVGGLQPVARARLEGNESFGPAVSARSVQLGYGGSVMNEDVTLEDNFFVGRIAANGSWASGTLAGNTFHSTLVGIDPAMYPDNAYHDALPTGTRVVVRANAEDHGRADLVLYNWDERAEVEVELGDVLAEGAPYEVWSVFDLWGEPVVSGVYDGGAIAIPMGARAPVQPHGDPTAITGADDPGRTFGVFVLRSSCAVTAPSEPVRTTP